MGDSANAAFLYSRCKRVKAVLKPYRQKRLKTGIVLKRKAPRLMRFRRQCGDYSVVIIRQSGQMYGNVILLALKGNRFFGDEK